MGTNAELADPIRVLLYGACSVEGLVAPLEHAAAAHGLALQARATAFHDLRLVEELAPDALVIGHLRQKNNLFEFPPWPDGRVPVDAYVRVLRNFVLELRARSRAPIFVLNLPTPTLSPLGAAERGPDSHINRCRRLNLAIAEEAERHDDVWVVDVDAALGLHGRLGRVDDLLVGFGHLGALDGLLERFAEPGPGLQVYSEWLSSAKARATGAPAGPPAEEIIAEALLDLWRVVRGHGRRKCVVVDLDGTLWPGVLADTGEPFPGQPAFDTYPYGPFWGLHSALKALQARGVLLACVSKNDESVVRALWRYSGVPDGFFLTLDDFVATRINWHEKVDNIRALAEQLNLGLDAFVFVDDNPIERTKVERYLPQVRVLGQDPLATRRALLSDPELQVAHVTADAVRRTEMTRAQLQRDEARDGLDPSEFLEQLELELEIALLGPAAELQRAHELVLRTNQLNTTARRYTAAELQRLAADPDARVLTLRARDRFVDYGLVGVAVCEGSRIELLVLSCRVLGLGVEAVFLDAVVRELSRRFQRIQGRLLETARNLPARHLYADQGFSPASDALWELHTTRYTFERPAHCTLRERLVL